MRKYYIDNLRWMSVLLVIPYHVFLCYNTYGYKYYVYASPVAAFSTFNLLCVSWFMPLLFFVSGISSAYGLQKRTSRQYLAERFGKLLIPCFFGVLLLVPVMAYFARRHYDGYAGGIADHYLHFFATWSQGSTGVPAYDLGQMWFLLYLCVISTVALPIIRLGQAPCRRLRMESWPRWAIISLSIPLWAVWQLTPSHPQSLAGCFVLFLLGALFFANDALQDKLAQWRWSLFIPFAVLSLVWINVDKNLLSSWWGTLLQALIMWTGVLSCMGLGKRYLNFSGPATAYLSASSFALYIFHQSWLVGIAYYVTRTTEPAWTQAAVILSACLAATLATYELCRRIALTRYMFGVKR